VTAIRNADGSITVNGRILYANSPVTMEDLVEIFPRLKDELTGRPLLAGEAAPSPYVLESTFRDGAKSYHLRHREGSHCVEFFDGRTGSGMSIGVKADDMEVARAEAIFVTGPRASLWLRACLEAVRLRPKRGWAAPGNWAPPEAEARKRIRKNFECLGEATMHPQRNRPTRKGRRIRIGKARGIYPKGEGMTAQDLVGTAVVYVSASGKEYEATVTGIPENPGHAGTAEPTVSLEFRDERGKLVRKKRVIPTGVGRITRMVWRRKG